MNPRTLALVAGDVVREAIASRFLLVLFGIILLGLGNLMFALDLEVVNGAIAAGKLFGGNIMTPDHKPEAVRQVLGQLLQVVVGLTMYLGTPLLIIAVADIAPKMFAPGRVEHMLALPIRRAELMIGTYLGVVVIAVTALVLAVGGASAIFFVKTEVATPAPLVGAICALIGFLTIYALMLFLSVVTRSVALAAGFGIFFFFFGVATSNRAQVLALIKKPAVRDAVEVALAPVPRFATLVDVGGSAALGAPVDWGNAFAVAGGALALGAFFLVVTCALANHKDY